jgi:leader peptidase (prepilin peptidase)/N-methyltransferase
MLGFSATAHIVAAGLGLCVGFVVSVTSRWMSQRRVGMPASVVILLRRPAWRDLWSAALAAGLFILATSQFDAVLKLTFVGIYTALFLLIALVDIDHRLVPNALVAIGSLVALTASLINQQPSVATALAGGIFGLVLFTAITLLSGGALGMGDVKLAALIGLALGFPGVARALLLGAAFGGIGSGVLLVTRRADLRTAIPYAPFLVAGAWIELLLRA